MEENTFASLITPADDLVFIELSPAELNAVDRETKLIIQSMNVVMNKSTNDPKITAKNMVIKYQVQKTPQRPENRIVHIMYKIVRAFEQAGYIIKYVKEEDSKAKYWFTFYWKIRNPPDETEDKNFRIHEYLKIRRAEKGQSLEL